MMDVDHPKVEALNWAMMRSSTKVMDIFAEIEMILERTGLPADEIVKIRTELVAGSVVGILRSMKQYISEMGVQENLHAGRFLRAVEEFSDVSWGFSDR